MDEPGATGWEGVRGWLFRDGVRKGRLKGSGPRLLPLVNDQSRVSTEPGANATG
jgi:hypothetical protein